MPAMLTCRQCGAELTHKADSCTQCGCRPPFACSVCETPIGAITLRVPRSPKYPFGSFSEGGEPRCHQHRPTRCYRCDGLFFKAELTRAPGRDNAMVCTDCRALPRERPPAPETPGLLKRASWVVAIVLLLVLVLAAAVIGTILFNDRI